MRNKLRKYIKNVKQKGKGMVYRRENIRKLEKWSRIHQHLNKSLKGNREN